MISVGLTYFLEKTHKKEFHWQQLCSLPQFCPRDGMEERLEIGSFLELHYFTGQRMGERKVFGMEV